NDDWVVEQKCDGQYMDLLYKMGRITASNKLGKGIPVPMHLADAMRELVAVAGCDISLGLAGEYLHNALHVFGVWGKQNATLERVPNHLRIAIKDKLEATYRKHLIDTARPITQPIRFVYTAKTREEKWELVDTLRNNDAEGIILKHKESNETSYKLKFWESTEVLLVANHQRS